MNNGGRRKIKALALMGCVSLAIPGLMHSGTTWSSAKPQEPVQLEEPATKVAQAAVLVLPDIPPSSPRAAFRSLRLPDVPGEQEVLVLTGSASPKNSGELDLAEDDLVADCAALAQIAARHQSQQAAAHTSPSLSALNPEDYDLVPSPRKVLAISSSAETTPATSAQASPSLSPRHLAAAAILAQPLEAAFSAFEAPNAQLGQAVSATPQSTLKRTKSQKRRERKRKASLSASQELTRSKELAPGDDYCSYNYCAATKAACTDKDHAAWALFNQQQ